MLRYRQRLRLASAAMALVFITLLSLAPARAQIDTASPLILRPVTDEPGFGKGLAMGDVNGDGYVDIIVGSVLSTVNGLKNAGRVFIFFGGPVPSTAPDLALASPVPEGGARFGWSIALGDVNRDGYDDVITSALFANGGVSNGLGEVYVFFGGPAIDPRADVTLASPPALGSQAHFGWAIAVGDINGDGAKDIIVGADNVRIMGAQQAGGAFVYFGAASFNGALNLTLQSPMVERAGGFGSALAVADFSADGIDDLAVGAPGQTAGATPESGQVYVFRGGRPFTAADPLVLQETSPTRLARFGIALAAGDVNGDGRQDLIVGATNPPSLPIGPQNRGEVYVFSAANTDGPSPPTVFDQRSVTGFGNPLSAGDVNRDGISDIIAGVPATSVGRKRAAGQALIFSGGPALDGIVDIRLESPAPATNELFGTSVAAGDFNADGRTDIVVSAIFVSTVGKGGPGRAYVFLGQ